MSGGLRVLITGASAGIGAALAREFARRGARVLLTARRRDRLETLAAELRAAGGEALAAECDVTKDGDPESAVAAARAAWGGLDVCVANAGFGVVGPFAELSPDDYRRQFETNVFGAMRTARAAMSELRASRGRLALMGSVMGHLPLPGASAYAMSKFALRALSESLRDEWRPLGVSVTLLSPGFVASDFRRTGNDGAVHAAAPEPVPSWLVMPADRAARIMARAILARRRERVVTAHGRITVTLYRHAPWLVRAAVRLGGVERSKDLAPPA